MATDKDFGRTDTMKIGIDTGNHRPIKKNSYLTPLKLQDQVDQAWMVR